MKLESLVIADQRAAVNTFPGLVHTARHTTRVESTRSLCSNRKEGAAPRGRIPKVDAHASGDASFSVFKELEKGGLSDIRSARH